MLTCCEPSSSLSCRQLQLSRYRALKVYPPSAKSHCKCKEAWPQLHLFLGIATIPQLSAHRYEYRAIDIIVIAISYAPVKWRQLLLLEIIHSNPRLTAKVQPIAIQRFTGNESSPTPAIWVPLAKPSGTYSYTHGKRISIILEYWVGQNQLPID